MKLSITIKPAKYTSTSRSQILKDILSGKSHTIAGIPVDIQGSYIVYSIQKNPWSLGIYLLQKW